MQLCAMENRSLRAQVNHDINMMRKMRAEVVLLINLLHVESVDYLKPNTLPYTKQTGTLL